MCAVKKFLSTLCSYRSTNFSTRFFTGCFLKYYLAGPTFNDDGGDGGGFNTGNPNAVFVIHALKIKCFFTYLHSGVFFLPLWERFESERRLFYTLRVSNVNRSVGMLIRRL